MAKIYCDGAGWSGDCCKYAIAIDDKEPEITRLDEYHTSNEMEYQAVYSAACRAQTGDTILTDSQLVVNQVHGLWKVRHAKFLPTVSAIRALMRNKRLNLKWVRRNENKAGIALEKDK